MISWMMNFSKDVILEIDWKSIHEINELFWV
jgi:hypothetical protein